MKRFSFRLQTLLDIRKKSEDDLKKTLAVKNMEILKARQARQSMTDTLALFFTGEKQHREVRLDARELRLSISYRTQLQHDILSQDRVIYALLTDAERLRTLLVGARKDCRILEILKEKKIAHWKKMRSREEQKIVDDMSTTAYIRRRNLTHA